jgi:hypothetical protein
LNVAGSRKSKESGTGFQPAGPATLKKDQVIQVRIVKLYKGIFKILRIKEVNKFLVIF